jgi:23S rRNA pseudouridine1911/1915/1917 synthase
MLSSVLSAEEWMGASEPQIRICYADESIVVVDKPPGLTTMRHPEEAAEFGARGRRFLPTTLADLLPVALSQREGRPADRVRPVHRIDKETSGLVVFARTGAAEGHLGKQFREHTVERTYLALVRGSIVDQRMESWFVADRGDHRRGSGPQSSSAKRAVTHVRVLESLPGYALVECRLETGRTHQVRIHLGEAGAPLCGERVYDRPIHGRPAPDKSGAPRIALHAATLGLIHPKTDRPMRWQSPLPEDLKSLWQELRRYAR